MMNDNYTIKATTILNGKGQKVASIKDLKKNHSPVVLHKGERVIETDIKKLHQLEKKYNTRLYPRRKI